MAAATAVIVPGASLCRAQTRNWIGATNSDWSTASNWDTGVPNSSTSATFTGGTSQNQSVIVNSANSACFFLTDSGIQQIQAGSYPLAVGGDLNIYPQPGAGPANLTLQSGTVSVAGNTNIGGTSSGSVGAGYLEIDSGATLNVTGTTTIWSNGLPNSNGALNLSGGTLSTAALNDGNNPSLLNWTSGTLSITSQNPFNIQSGQPLGGIVTLNSGMTLSLSNAQYVSEVGSVTINPGGQLNCANFLVGNGGNANLAVTGGTFGCSGLTIVGNGSSNSGALNVSGGGSLTTATLYDGLASSGTNTITVSGSGSTIVASSVIYVGSQNSGPAQFNVLNGGSVQANSSSGYVTVGSGGGSGTLTLGTSGTTDSGALLASTGGIYIGGDSTSYSGSLGTGVVWVYGGTTLSTPGTLQIWNSAGTALNLFGGTVSAGIFVASGLFDWNSGTLNLTNSGLSISSTGWTANLELHSGMNLNTSGGITIANGGSLYVTGGTLTAPSLNINDGGSYNQTSGVASLGNVSNTGSLSISGGTLKASSLNVTSGNLRWTRGSINVTGTAGITIGVPYTIQSIGPAYESEPSVMNNAGTVAGTNLNSSTGASDAWAYLPAAKNTVQVGLPSSHMVTTSTEPVYPYYTVYNETSVGNSVVAISSASEVAGYTSSSTYHYSEEDPNYQSYTSSSVGSAWVWSPALNNTTTIGLSGANMPVGIDSGGRVYGNQTGFNNYLQQAWVWSPATNTTVQIGPNGGVVNDVNSAGQAVGSIGYPSSSGAWLYNAASGTTTLIGPTDAAHTNSTGGNANGAYLINAPGQVVGTAYRYGSGHSVLGTDTWIYSPSTGSTQIIGPLDSLHTQPGTYSIVVSVLSNSGYVAGSAETAGGGEDAWLYSPLTGLSTIIGLTDSLHLRNGTPENYPGSINAYGEVAGSSTRYVNGVNAGVDSWVYDPRTSITYTLSGPSNSSGGAYCYVNYLGDNGTALGQYESANGSYEPFIWTEQSGMQDLGLLVQGGLTAAGWSQLGSVVSIDSAGQIVGYGNIADASGYSALELTPSATAGITVSAGMSLNDAGPVNVQSGGFVSLQGGSITAQAIALQSGASFNWTSGTLAITGSGSSFDGSVTVPKGGLLLLSGAITDPISVSAGGVFNILQGTGTGIQVRQLNTISITANSGGTANGEIFVQPATAAANRQLIEIAGLNIAGTTNAWQGLVGVANNDLDLQSGNLATVTNQIAEGYDGGIWRGAAGITSGTAAADTTHLTALGVIQNNQSGGTLFNAGNPFDGTTPGAGDILVKYTYYGDTNLDGKVDGSDYSRIDNAYSYNEAHPNHYTGWFNGDFNYDNVIDGSDYTLMDNAYNTQGAALSAQVALPTAQVAGGSVPEPTTLSLLAISAAGLLGRRRRN